MDESPQEYQHYIEVLDEKKHQKEITHTIYLSRRAIWANFIFCFLSPLAGYFHTRRWKALGIFTVIVILFSIFTSEEGETFEDSFKNAEKYSFWISLIAFVDNTRAIRKAQEKVNNQLQ